jgi:diguanylate cyclase (GGDEF)-like protein
MSSSPKDTPSDPTIPTKLLNAVNVLRRLTQPPASVPALDRRRAHLLAWLLLVAILLTLSGLILELVVNPPGSPLRGEYFWLILLLAILFSLAFGLLRAGYYQYSAILTTLCAVCAPWGSLVLDPAVLDGDLVPLTFITISILLSSILLSPLFTGILAGLQLIVVLVIAGLNPAAPFNWPSLLALIFVTSVLSILVNIINQRDLERIEQQTRQLELDAVRQTQLLEEAQKRIKQMTVLHQVATTATQVDSLDRLIGLTTDIICKNLSPDNCGIFLLDEEQGLLRPHPSYQSALDRHLVLQDIPLGRGITGQVAQIGQTIRIGKTDGIQNYVDIDQGISSELCVPIRYKDKVLGVINVESVKPDAFSVDDEQLLGTLAGQLATAIEQLRATDAEHRWLGQLAHSNELIRALSSNAAHLQKALNQDEIVQTLGNDLRTMGLTCAVAVRDRDGRLFTFKYTSIPEDDLEQLQNQLGSSFLNYSFSLDLLTPFRKKDERYEKPIVVLNTEEPIHLFFPGWPGGAHPTDERGRENGSEATAFRLPLLFEETLLGILWVWGAVLMEGDLSVLSNFAQQVASALKRAQLFQEIESLALTDPLTGLQNRRGLFELGKIEFARSQRMDRHFCCLMLDIDHFKTINDEYGHPIGDLVLQDFAQVCKRSVRAADLPGRYGGEELVIFLPETDLDTAVQIAERLRESIEKMPIQVSGREVHVTVSIGVSRRDESTLELETLIARADQAMYIAKYKGRNQVAISK